MPHRIPVLPGGPPSSTKDRPVPRQGPFPLLRAATPGQTATRRPRPDALPREHSRCFCLSDGDDCGKQACAACRLFECEPRWQPQPEAHWRARRVTGVSVIWLQPSSSTYAGCSLQKRPAQHVLQTRPFPMASVTLAWQRPFLSF